MRDDGVAQTAHMRVAVDRAPAVIGGKVFRTSLILKIFLRIWWKILMNLLPTNIFKKKNY